MNLQTRNEDVTREIELILSWDSGLCLTLLHNLGFHSRSSRLNLATNTILPNKSIEKSN